MKLLNSFVPAWLGILLVALWLTSPAQAQFSTTASQTQYVCNATGNQFGVQAFADGAGGSYTVWIDKRGGNNTGPGTAIYAQRLDAAGNALLPANGSRLFQSSGREIFGMRAIPWQNGLLVAWVQGGFGIGGDSVRCQYYNPAGVAQWAQPTLIAARVLSGGIIYQSEQGLNIIPTSTGATITHALALTGGSNRFTYNQVSLSGVLRFAMSSRQVTVIPPSGFALDYYYTVGDGSDGFYMVASAGGFTSAILAQRFDAAGVALWANLAVVSPQGPSGRGSEWQPLIDPAGNLYVAWTSSAGDPLVTKVLPSGSLGWAAPGYVNLCTFAAFQTTPFALWHNNALWMIWSDARLGGNNFAQYAQKIDAAGTLAWSAAGVLVCDLPAAFNAPKLAPSDNGTAMAFFSTPNSTPNTQGFRAQKIRPDGTVVFPANGTFLHSVLVDRPNDKDYIPVAQPNGSVQVYWSSTGGTTTGQDICTGRMQSTGTLLGTEQAAAALGFDTYPNPATDELRLRCPMGQRPLRLRLYDAQGRLVRAFADGATALPLHGLPVGLYVVRATLAGQEVSRRVAVE